MSDSTFDENLEKLKFDASPGERAYNAYCCALEGKSVSGEPLPSFREQAVQVIMAWEAAAEAVLEEAT
jgi:hypothetical protein